MKAKIAKEDFISSREESAVIAEAIKGEKYFGRKTYNSI